MSKGDIDWATMYVELQETLEKERGEYALVCTPKEYQEAGAKLWLTQDTTVENLTHALFGLATETGEVIDLFKKTWFTPDRIDNWDKTRVQDELGDILYYICRIADQYSISLDDIMEANINKLKERYPNGSE